MLAVISGTDGHMICDAFVETASFATDHLLLRLINKSH